MQPTRFGLIVLAIAMAAYACVDRNGPVEPEPPPAALDFVEPLDASAAAFDRIAQGVAMALADSAVRTMVLEDMRDSPFPLHALHLNSYLNGSRGEAIVRAAADRMRIDPSAFRQLLAGLPSVQLWASVASDRAEWTGGANVAVTYFPESFRPGDDADAPEDVPAFDIRGRAIRVPIGPPPHEVVTLTIAPARLAFGQDPEHTRAAAPRHDRRTISTKGEELAQRSDPMAADHWAERSGAASPLRPAPSATGFPALMAMPRWLWTPLGPWSAETWDGSAGLPLPFFRVKDAELGSALFEVNIAGPWYINSGDECTWTPEIPGVGGPSYSGTIRWTISGQLVSPVWSYTDTHEDDFVLRLEVWSPDGEYDWDELPVNVSGGGATDCTDPPDPPDPPGFDLGITWDECYPVTFDADRDGLAENCEYVLANAFRPFLVFHRDEVAWSREEYWAATVDLDPFDPESHSVKIFYLFALHRDLPPVEHNGDSEFAELRVTYNETYGVWQFESILLSAHWHSTWYPDGGDWTATYGPQDVEFHGEILGRPRVYVSLDHHGLFNTDDHCDDRWGDECDPLMTGIRQDFAVYPDRNIGDYDANPTNECMTLGVLIDQTSSTQGYPGTEYFWWMVAPLDIAPKFAGWQGPGGTTPYPEILDWYLWRLEDC